MGKHLKNIRFYTKCSTTDGLWEDNRTDEDQLGASYVELEWAMEAHKNKLSKSNFTHEK